MPETYCGKICAECTQKELMGCSGCKSVPGQQFSDDCELAECCIDKGHETCDTCGFKEDCKILQNRERQPEYRKRKIEAELRHKEAIKDRALILGKWLLVLFWLRIAATAASFIAVVGSICAIIVFLANYMPGQALSMIYVIYIDLILSIICTIIYCVIMLKLSSEEDRYRTAGICALVSTVASAFVIIIFGAAEASAWWSLIITLPAGIVGLVGEYKEFSAHSIVLTGVDNVLSDKWVTLWKCDLGCKIGLIGAVIPTLGPIILRVAEIGLIIIYIMELIYLYRTAKAFREYTANDVVNKN